jgi:hypothetical protein
MSQSDVQAGCKVTELTAAELDKVAGGFISVPFLLDIAASPSGGGEAPSQTTQIDS